MLFGQLWRCQWILQSTGISILIIHTFTPCENDLSTVLIELTTDIFPEDTSWKIADDDTGNVMLQGGDYDADESTTFVSQTCISNESCLRLQFMIHPVMDF